MDELNRLIESLLLESVSLTKGSQRVLNDKKLVPELADAVRDDAQSNPSAFPSGAKKNFQKATDEDVARWFLENIDTIEREGYEGNIYSRDGVNNDWIVRRYIASSHSWEDLTGVMNMNLNDWYLLKNRGLLDDNHKDIPKFKSVRDIGYYMTTHYKDELEKARDAVRNANRNKMAKSLKLVDNDDYRIYTTLNRAAGCLLGLGTQWCTANSNSGTYFHRYSNNAMLFQLFPYTSEKDENGKKIMHANEKYQFDAGGPNFMDVTDTRVPARVVLAKFPYLYADLTDALNKNKSKIEKYINEMKADPSLQGDDYRVKDYNVSEEIKKLGVFISNGYMQDTPRQGALPDPTNNQSQPPQEPQMETIKQLARAMLEDKKLGQIVQKYVPIGDTEEGQMSPLTQGDSNLDEEEFDSSNVSNTTLDQAKQALLATLSSRHSVAEDDENILPPDSQVANVSDMGQSSSTNTQYAPGTAPTMPESINQGNIMENVDKDVAAVLNSFKKYDKLNESVLGMVTLSMKPTVVEKDEGKHNNGTTTGFKAVEKIAEKEYGSKEAGEKVAGAVRNKMKATGKIEEAGPAQTNPIRFLISYLQNTTSEAASYDDWIDEGIQVTMSRFPGVTYDELRNHPRVINYIERDGLQEAGPAKKDVPAFLRKEKGGDWKTSKEDLEKEKDSKLSDKDTLAKNTGKKVDESADQDVLDWMNRFSQLGNMKGYGR